MRRRYVALQTLKILLVGVVCAGATGLVLFYQQEEANADEFEVPSLKTMDVPKEEWNEESFSSKALNANFEAIDEKGQPYIIKAESATELDNGTVELDVPTYTITLNNQTVVVIKSLKGHLDQANKKLTLTGDVVVHYGNEYTFKTPISRIDLRYGYAHGDQSIQGTSDAMQLTAGQYRIEEKGNRVILNDRPKLKIHLES